MQTNILLSAASAIFISKSINVFKELYFANRMATSIEAENYITVLIYLGVCQIAGSCIHDKLNSELREFPRNHQLKVIDKISLIITGPMLFLAIISLSRANSIFVEYNFFLIIFVLFTIVLVRINVESYYACLKARDQGFLSILIPSTTNIFIIMLLYFYEVVNLQYLLFAFSLGSVFELLTVRFLISSSIKYEKNHSMDFNYSQLFKSAFVLFPATTIVTLMPLVENAFLSQKEQGAIALNAYAQRIPMALSGLLIVFINTYSIRFIKQKLYKTGNLNYFKNMINLRNFIAAGFLGMFGILASDTVATIVYLDTSFNSDEMKNIRLQQVIFFIAFGLIALTSYLGKYLIVTNQEMILTAFIFAQALVNILCLYAFKEMYFSVPLSSCITSCFFLLLMYFKETFYGRN